MCSICMVYEGDAAHLHVTTKNTNKLTQCTKNGEEITYINISGQTCALGLTIF